MKRKERKDNLFTVKIIDEKTSISMMGTSFDARRLLKAGKAVPVKDSSGVFTIKIKA